MPPGSRLAKLLPLAAALAVGLAAPTGTLHTLIYLGLLILFGRSLLPRREPLVTRIARDLRGGTLPPDLARYTARVTWAWLLFCAAQLLASALLHQFASHRTWWSFVNLLDLPLLALMAVSEYAYRRWRYRQHAHTSPATMLAVMRRPVREWLKQASPGSGARPR